MCYLFSYMYFHNIFEEGEKLIGIDMLVIEHM